MCCPGKPPDIGSLCCPTGYICGNKSKDSKENCICRSKVVCGSTCCKPGEDCQFNLLGSNVCEKRCPGGGEKCIGVCCTPRETCGFFGCSCKSGLVSAGAGTCVSPRTIPAIRTRLDPFRNMFNTIGQAAASRGGGRPRRAMFAGSAQSASVAVDAALVALAAVNGQGAAAMLAIRNGKRDPAFRQKVTVARATPPKLSADSVLNGGSAAALNKLLVAEAEAYALIAAMAKALWRARAAHAKKNSAAARSQLRASATFAAQAATALKRIQALRTGAARGLKAGKVPEVWAFDPAVDAFVAAVRSGGIPAFATRADGQARGWKRRPQAAARGSPRPVCDRGRRACLIAPLLDPARAKDLKSLISELSKYAARARKHPIAR